MFTRQLLIRYILWTDSDLRSDLDVLLHAIVLDHILRSSAGLIHTLLLW